MQNHIETYVNDEPIYDSICDIHPNKNYQMHSTDNNNYQAIAAHCTSFMKADIPDQKMAWQNYWEWCAQYFAILYTILFRAFSSMQHA